MCDLFDHIECGGLFNSERYLMELILFLCTLMGTWKGQIIITILLQHVYRINEVSKNTVYNWQTESLQDQSMSSLYISSCVCVCVCVVKFQPPVSPLRRCGGARKSPGLYAYKSWQARHCKEVDLYQTHARDFVPGSLLLGPGFGWHIRRQIRYIGRWAGWPIHVRSTASPANVVHPMTLRRTHNTAGHEF